MREREKECVVCMWCVCGVYVVCMWCVCGVCERVCEREMEYLCVREKERECVVCMWCV